jgi:hypothetical protein
MPNRSAVLHPRLKPHVQPQFYPDRMSIETRVEIEDPESGEVNLGWVVRPGYESIPAVMAPAMIFSIGNREIVGDKQTWAESAWHVSFDGYWPDITPLDRLVIDDGRDFNILAVEHDSRRQFTRLKVEIVE